jgi:MFS-type transporter involved in bile tolerance (Atg22 family)
VSLTLFLPICLEQFARDNGFLLPDRIHPCSPSTNTTQALEQEARCVVKIGWAWIDTASFRYVYLSFPSSKVEGTLRSLYIYSISVALQAITVISMGGIADHRKFVHCKLRNRTEMNNSSPSQTVTSLLCSPWFDSSYHLPLFIIFLSCLVPLGSTCHIRKCRIRSICRSYERIYPIFSPRLSRSCSNLR